MHTLGRSLQLGFEEWLNKKEAKLEADGWSFVGEEKWGTGPGATLGPHCVAPSHSFQAQVASHSLVF